MELDSYIDSQKKGEIFNENQYIKINQDKSKVLFPTLVLKPPYFCARAMPRTKKGQQKVKLFRKTIVLLSL